VVGELDGQVAIVTGGGRGSGHRLAFALFVNDAGPLRRIEAVSEVFEDEVAIPCALYERA
jgi:NAD(P)-dependent dehydrogenase (short-subunit alcohol dehydrogenase family)